MHRVGREIQKIQIFVETVHLVAVDFRTARDEQIARRYAECDGIIVDRRLRLDPAVFIKKSDLSVFRGDGEIFAEFFKE